MDGNRIRNPGKGNTLGFDSSTFRKPAREVLWPYASLPMRKRGFNSPFGLHIQITVQGLVGEASAFQAEERGSIPRARSILFSFVY